ncbi:hypothetical protein [Spirosoma luteum]|uniref:hypothetical protein n=1 Tax=Spirosoma luteum TaxID=431553 RepID=UPI0003775745|nr:hypothetical protein [Spirosoma luteum]
MTYPEFEARWKPTGGAERANYSPFLKTIASHWSTPPPPDKPVQDVYVLERAMEFNDSG